MVRRMLSILSMMLMLVLPASADGGVGLVLSGGGAKGMAHIGLIRALEENEIPIDYIAGTSIGAVVGSMYVMGYTPDEMAELIGSEQFRQWYEGEKDPSYQFYFKQDPPSPTLATVSLDIRDSLIFVRPNTTSLVNPQQMNLGFVDIYSGANAACRENFDSLFVPFRSVAADVFNKKPIVLDSGDLSDAVRASMSFPFVFKPIRIDSIIAYDGGIYNNFPLDVMLSEFNPDFVIGSIVSGEEEFPDEYDLYGQIKNMIIQASDYSMPDSVGVRIEYNLSDVGLLDFHRITEVELRGYELAMQYVDSIKQRMPYRATVESVMERRREFKSRFPEVVFHRIEINGGTEEQRDYMVREFRQNLPSLFDYEGLKQGYFRLLSDGCIQEIMPKTFFNPEDSTFTLHLDVDFDERPQVRIGGALSSSTTSQLYGAISYKTLSEFSTEYLLEGQIGKLYKNAQITSRFDMASRVPMAMSAILSYWDLDYYNRNSFFSSSISPISNKEIEFFGKVKLSLPFLDNNKAEFSLGAAHHKDYYSQGQTINLYTFKYDVSRYNMFGWSVKFCGTTLDYLQYPTNGRSHQILAQIYTSNESIRPGGIKDKSFSENQSWLQMSCHFERYYHLEGPLHLGGAIDGYYSTRNFSENYDATMMQAGYFTPTPNSQFMYDPNFRANEYIAMGIKPIYVINSHIHLRGEVYGFMPFKPILQDENMKAYYGEPLSRTSIMTEASIVARYGRISANSFISARSTNWNNLTFGVTVGILLLNERFIEH